MPYNVSERVQHDGFSCVYMSAVPEDGGVELSLQGLQGEGVVHAIIEGPCANHCQSQTLSSLKHLCHLCTTNVCTCQSMPQASCSNVALSKQSNVHQHII